MVLARMPLFGAISISSLRGLDVEEEELWAECTMLPWVLLGASSLGGTVPCDGEARGGWFPTGPELGFVDVGAGIGPGERLPPAPIAGLGPGSGPGCSSPSC